MRVDTFVEQLNKVKRGFRCVRALRNDKWYNGLYWGTLYVSAVPIDEIFFYKIDSYKFNPEVKHKCINDVL